MQNSCLEIVPNSCQYNILKLILAVSITCSKLANLSGNFVTATSKQNLPSILLYKIPRVEMFCPTLDVPMLWFRCELKLIR